MNQTLLILLTATPLTLVLAWLFWRSAAVPRLITQMAFFERELGKQSEHSRALGGVVKRHVQQSLEARQQVRQVQRQLEALRRQALEGRTCDTAIARVRKGQDLKPLISSGDLNCAEAHLIRLVHSRQPEAAQPRPAARLS